MRHVHGRDGAQRVFGTTLRQRVGQPQVLRLLGLLHTAYRLADGHRFFRYWAGTPSTRPPATAGGSDEVIQPAFSS
jgi:hypothetical protein